ncbi:MAG: hypothetical protein JWL61_1298 [Gemmatimonadetes bacterium]|nr:hypothetical protein [Gemmatimonadota bacterium]
MRLPCRLATLVPAMCLAANVLCAQEPTAPTSEVFRRDAAVDWTLRSWEVRLYDRLAIPLLSRIEGVFAPPIGQSLFAVAEPME